MSEQKALNRWRRSVPAIAGIVLVAIAIALMHHELRNVRYHEIVARVRAIPALQLLESAGLTMLVYAVLPLYDLTALAYVGHPLPRRRAVFASVISYAISQTLGFPALTGGGVRYRFWASWGLNGAEIARAVAFVGVTFSVGIATVSALVLLAQPDEAARILHLTPVAGRVIGGLLFLCPVAYLVVAGRLGGRTVSVRSLQFPLPSLGIAGRQLLIPIADWLLAAAVLYVLLPPNVAPGFLPFVCVFVLAQFAGIVSHVPAGAGVFESIMLILLRTLMPADQVLGTIIAYRVIYYIAPFALGVGALVVHEAWSRRKHLGVAASLATRWGSAVTPQVLAAATFLAGVVLLLSGATPSVHSRLAWLDDLLPLGVIEVSHFAGSLIGVALVVLAWALWHRLDAAWSLTVALLGLGALTALFKGLDWEEALILTAVLGVLVPMRGEFYRKGALLYRPLEPGWIAALIGVVGASIWLGVFSFKHVEFQQELFWQFTTHGDAPRFLRASAGALAGVATFGLMRLLRYSEAEPALPSPDDLATAATIASTSSDTVAYLALLGAKCLLFSDQKDAMLMYGVEGRSWIALGDPVGPDDAVAELAWRFRERADEHGAWPVFYEVTERRLALYIDLGLSFLKLGEEAVVPLADFSLEGSSRKGLRRTHRDFQKRGATFSMIPRESVPELLPALQLISNEWLESKATREKGFSLGRFDPAYLRHFPVAVVYEEGRPVAFANLWLGAPGTELSIDLMRYTKDAPGGVMEYLFIELMLWGRSNSFKEFSLGMAPLAGFEDRALGPLWNRAGAWLFRHGEHFYNFQGLRQYKEKFDPVWHPRYLASPGGLALPRILTNVASHIAGGVKGIVAK
jgi:phosphatidylglycerol lysyltransferase